MADFAVESHPQRPQIDAMLLSGISLTRIASAVTPNVTPMSLSRYKRAGRVMPLTTPEGKSNIVNSFLRNAGTDECASIPALPAPHATRTPLLERAEKLHQRIEKAMDAGESAVRVVETETGPAAVGADLRVLPPLFREANNSLRLLGELTGELNQASAQAASITINIVAAPAAVSSPFDLEVQAEPVEIGTEAG